MSVLILATSGSQGEIGLAPSAEGKVRVEVLGAGAERGRRVLAAVHALLAAEGRTPRDLEAILVDVGPGSFTGVRVGTTVGKTLAWALDCRVVGVVSLAALAQAAPADREVVAVRDAGRGRLYVARYGPAEGDVRPTLEVPARRPAGEVLSALGGRLLVGEDAPELVAARGQRADALRVRAGAEAVLAAARPALGSREAATPPHGLVPLYLQASAPERRRAGETDPGPAERGGNDRPRE